MNTSDPSAEARLGDLSLRWHIGRLHPVPDRVPAGWELVDLTSVAILESGHTPSRNNPRYWNGSIPWVSLHDSQALDVSSINNTAQSVTELGIANSSARILPAGTVIFSRTATVGKATVLGREMATSQDFANYVCGNRVHNHYLMYLLRFMQPEWKRLMAGSTHNTIYMPVFRVIQILLPPIDEQRAIAAALSDVDELIGALDKLIAKKRAIKLAAMQQLLTGKTRLPGFETNQEEKLTDIGRIPGDWRVVRLRECLRRPPNYGINAAAVPFDDTLPTYLRITDIDEYGYFMPSPKVSVRHANAQQYLLDDGDLVFARTGASVGKSSRYRPWDGPLVFAGFLIRVTPDSNCLDTGFLFHYVQSKRYWDWVAMMSARSGQPGINGQEYGQLLLPLPGIEEQHAISKVVSDMDAEIAALEQRRDKTKAIKQGMMQSLLTGRVRLVEPEGTP